MATHRIVQTTQYVEVDEGNRATRNVNTSTVTGATEYSETISCPTTDSDTLHTLSTAINITNLQAIFIKTTGPLTVKTNSSSTPDDTWTFPARGEISWTANDPVSNPVSANITTIYTTNSGGNSVDITFLGIKT